MTIIDHGGWAYGAGNMVALVVMIGDLYVDNLELEMKELRTLVETSNLMSKVDEDVTKWYERR